jgi:hypothetical protein
VTTVAGRSATVGMPMYLQALDTVNQLCVSDTTGGTLTLPAFPGFSLTVAAGSATFPGGSRSGCISATPVNPDKVPMAPGFGQQPRFILTIQPVGTTFNLNDGQIAAKFSGTVVGQGNFTVVNITLPTRIRAGSTPPQMQQDRIPPRIPVEFEVKIEPDLGDSGQTVTLAKSGTSSLNGDFSFDGDDTLDVTETGNISLSGDNQTAPSFIGAGGAFAGNLKLIAKVRDTQVAESNGFSVAAIAQYYVNSFQSRISGLVFGGDPFAAKMYGMWVEVGWDSDSEYVEDLDQESLKEVVHVADKGDVFSDVTDQTFQTSDYLPAGDAPTMTSMQYLSSISLVLAR